MVIDFVRKIFSLIFPISLLLSVFVRWEEGSKNAPEPPTENTTKLISAIRIAESLVAGIICIGTFIFITFRHKEWAWLCIVFCAPAYLSRIVGAYKSVGIIGQVVGVEKADKLSFREYWAIETASYALWFLDIYKLPDKLMEWAKMMPHTVTSDFLYIAIYAILLFLYVFLSCALLPTPLFCFSRLIIKVHEMIRKKIQLVRASGFFINRIERPVSAKPLLILAIDKTAYGHMVLRIAVWCVSPILFIADVALFIARMLWSFLLTSIGYIFLLLRMIKRTAGKMIAWINHLSDRHIVVISFRVALIAALTIVVINNRYEPLLKEYEASTGALEFIASAILIPVIFEWISTTKAQK